MTGTLKEGRMRLSSVAMAGVLLSLCSTLSVAQVHEEKAGAFVVRSNIIGSTFLEPSIAQRHDIIQSSDRGVLNVAVVRAGSDPLQTAPASVSAWAALDAGELRPIRMKEVVANDGVSYVGTFQSVPGAQLEFRVEARPDGVAEPIVMRFRDRMPVRMPGR